MKMCVKQMGEAAVKAAVAVDYTGAGTVEFIYEYKTKSFYFMEMNTRIQVEHPVTEMVTGMDLIKEQILVASGESYRYSKKKYNLMVGQLNAELMGKPCQKFMPSPGKVEMYLPPGGFGIRVDSAVYPGYSIPPSMIRWLLN